MNARGTRSILLVAALAALPAARAFAAEPAVTLDWRAPDVCPQRDDILKEVNRLIGPEPVAEPIVVRATVEAESASLWTVHLQTQLGQVQGERALRAKTCALAARAATLVVAAIVILGLQAGNAQAQGSGNSTDC